MGFLGVAIPEEYGGAGLGHLELCVIAEEIGRALAPVPFASSIYLAAEFLMLAGTEAQKQALAAQAGSRRGDRHVRAGRRQGRPTPALDRAQGAKAAS